MGQGWDSGVAGEGEGGGGEGQGRDRGRAGVGQWRNRVLEVRCMNV